VLRYIEANPLGGEMVNDATDWHWSSLAIRHGRKSPLKISDGPLKIPGNWHRLVNRIDGKSDFTELKTSLKRGQPFGTLDWKKKTAWKMNL
jgi:putative transposase